MNVGDVASPAAVAVDGSGSVVIVGKLTGTIDLGGGALTSAGGGDFFVAKYSASGVYLWARRAGSLADDRAGGVAVDRDGNVLVTGYFAGTIDLGGGVLTATGGNIFVAKYSAGGAHLWSESFGPTTTASGYAISNALAVDGSGNVVVGGLFAGVGDFGGGPLSGAGGSDIFVAKYTAAGGHVWSRRFGAASNDNVNGLTVDGGGNVLVTGDFTDTVDFGGGPVSSPVYSDMFIAKYTAAGEYLWSKNFGTSFVQETANGIAADANGNVVVTGSIYAALDLGGGILYPNGGKDFFVVKFSATGVHLWSKRAGDSFEDSGVCLTTDAAGNVLATGWFQNVINFGGGPLINYGASDTFLVKFAP
ncbi:MAG: SBBP repeat-containing protein [Patescibacteria group bacterium]